MSFGHQPPPPKTTGTGTIVGILALIFVGIPILLCIVGGVAIWGMAGFPGGKFGGGKDQAWQKVVAEKQRLERELIAELKTIAAANNNTIPASSVNQIATRGLEIDAKINELANRTHREHGEPSQAVKDELKSTEELRQYVSTLNLPSNRSPFGTPLPSFNTPQPPSVPLPDFAAQRAESEQRMAALRAEQAQRDAQRETERKQREEQLAAQRLADQQVREQRLRELAQPQPFVPPPVFNNPQPGAPQQPQANAPPPGYPATDITQLKLKDAVFVRVGDTWHPAFVQLKRGVFVTVRSTETGAVEQVTIERIRLQNEPTAKAEIAKAEIAKPDVNVPPAMRVVTAPKKSSGNKPEEEDDALFTAKPAGDQPTTTTPAASTPSGPVAPAKPVAPVAEYRTWTDDTGKFKVEAELVNFEFDLVTLRTRAGKVISMRIEKLSTGDQAVIRQKFQ